MMENTFECWAGNGRLYKLDDEKTRKEQERLRTLREDKGQAWATPDKAHQYDGFMQIGQAYINWLQEGLNQAGTETVRMNWKAHVAKMSNGSPCLHIKGSWFGNGMMDLKQFIESGATVTSPETQAPVEETGSDFTMIKDAQMFDEALPF